MSDYPSNYPPPPPVFNEFPRELTPEGVVNQQPPPYGFLNPSALNDTNNVDVKTPQFQPQPQPQPQYQPQTQWSTRNMYGAPATTNPEINNIENYMVWSVLNIIFCCLCLGFVACYYSSETNNHKIRGDFQSALIASRNARTINIIATVLGIILSVNYALYITGTY